MSQILRLSNSFALNLHNVVSIKHYKSLISSKLYYEIKTNISTGICDGYIPHTMKIWKHTDYSEYQTLDKFMRIQLNNNEFPPSPS